MDLAKAAIERIGVDGGLDMAIGSEAPPGSGLGGSSALVTAVVGALAAMGERVMSAGELARLAYAIEREDLGISGGWQDQYAAAFGGCNLLEFSAAGASVTPVRADPEVMERLRANLVLCYTGGVRRNVGLIDTQISMYRDGREDTILGMKQLHEMAYAMRDALEAGEPDRLGAMLREAFEAKRRMNPHIAEHTPIEAMLAAAREAGAAGGKICGAGGGGYLMVYAAPAAQPAVRAALVALGGQLASFGFRAEGVRAERDGVVWAPA
jgi:D-glycero-alpha-D-manno-heptose-7-phosphate kinase